MFQTAIEIYLKVRLPAQLAEGRGAAGRGGGERRGSDPPAVDADGAPAPRGLPAQLSGILIELIVELKHQKVEFEKI